MADLVLRRAALTRLAIATRERLPEDRREREAYFHIYLDGFDRFSDDTFARACLHLETALAWFPKKLELLDACRSIAERKAEQRRPRLALLPGDKPITPEKHAEILARFRAVLREKAMPAPPSAPAGHEGPPRR